LPDRVWGRFQQSSVFAASKSAVWLNVRRGITVLSVAMSQFGTTSKPQTLRFRKDEPIYFEGDSASTWYMVESGVARTCRFHADGHRQLTGFYLEGDVFGVDEAVRLDAAEAVTELCCSAFTLRTAAEDQPVILDADRQEALKLALRNAYRSIFLFGRRTAPERIAAFVLMIAARQRAREQIELAMSRSDIADYLGLTIHTVSRTLSQLCQDGSLLLDGPHHCRILNRPALERLAGEAGQPLIGESELIREHCAL
jgi:CRP-like cAMP-binding protein